MRAVVQRVSSASVQVDGTVVGEIGPGLCALVGVAQGDDHRSAELLAKKVVGLRIFRDEAGKMNLSVSDVGGAILAISQFTLLGDVRRGHRPSFSSAMQADRAAALFEQLCTEMRAKGVRVETGRFQADMRVALVNEGPVTILIDTEKAF